MKPEHPIKQVMLLSGFYIQSLASMLLMNMAVVKKHMLKKTYKLRVYLAFQFNNTVNAVLHVIYH